jgi:DNA-binding GntR family transcriptional regulator
MASSQKRDSEVAYDKLVELVLSGAVSENVALSERGLAEKFGLGRTPIREAIKSLVSEGVLESHPTRGTVLRPLTVIDLQDLYEIRFAIEGLSAFLAAQRGRIDDLAPFAKRFDATLRKPDTFSVTEVHDHGVAFHFEIMRLAGNRRLLEMYRPFRLRFRIPFGIIRQRNPERVLAAVAEHREILAAIVAREPDQAQRLMRDHLQRGLDFRMDMLVKRDRYVVPPVDLPAPKAATSARKKTSMKRVLKNR